MNGRQPEPGDEAAEDPGSEPAGDSPLDRAHHANESGIRADRSKSWEEARRWYRRSIGYGVQPEVPTHNLARSRTLAANWSEAHDLYQEALALAPDTASEVHLTTLYDDGVALWRWGAEERDPEGCQLERTRDLWRASQRRFASVAGGAGTLAREARANLSHVTASLAEIDALIADPPEACRAGGGAAAGGGEGGTGDSDSTPQEDDGGGAGGTADPRSPPAAGGDDEVESGDESGSSGSGGQDEEDGEGDDRGEADRDGEGAEGEAGGRSEGGAGAGALEEARARIEEQRGQGGRFFRRTSPEQFPADSWRNPDPVVRW